MSTQEPSVEVREVKAAIAALQENNDARSSNCWDVLLKSIELSALQEKSPNGRSLFLQLKKQPGGTLRLDKLGLKGEWSERPQVKTAMPDWWRGTKHFGSVSGWDDFLILRNTLAHRYVSVPEALARDGLQFVRANVEDFFGQKMSDVPMRAGIVPWARLCELCQLDFLPPRLRV